MKNALLTNKYFNHIDIIMSCNKKTKSDTDSDTDMHTVDYYVYTDGACVGNGKANAIAGIGVYFGNDDIRNVSRRIEGKQSNNTAELGAIIQAFDLIKKDISKGKRVTIVSDSKYAIGCVTTYGKKCEKKDWNLDIPNKDLVKQAYELFKNKSNIQFMHIKAHTGGKDIHSIGNENADKLANMAIGLNDKTSTKIYLNVPYAKKEEAKKLGALWDNNSKKWFVYDHNKNKNQVLELFNCD
jgi:ribonuclease HI